MNKHWELCSVDEKKVNEISEKFKISKLVATIIANKKLKKEEQIETFLNPKRDNFYNPFLMPDMEKATNRIIKAIENKEKTIIYGDYDVDGITSTTIFKRYLEERGLNAEIYIPNRLDEGYGLNEDAINKIAENKYNLIITVDCGITGIKEVELANNLGIDVIITDHHEVGENLPNAIAIVDCKRKDSKYPFNSLAGVGVTFKTIQAISKKLNLPEESYLKYLDIVCVGTISDIVPLEDENRVISKLGLKLIKQTQNIGLKILLESIGYKEIDSNTISFGIAPRINACGRMGHEKEAVKLFLTNSIEEARNITKLLNKYNQERQEIEKRILNEAIELIENNNNDNSCIVIGKENWHHGVIGIVASKITEIYEKPTILLCYENGIAKGSGRSINGFDLYKALESCSSSIEQYGGHSMAIGITIKEENIKMLKENLEDFAQKEKIKELLPSIQVDEKVDLKTLKVNDIRELKLLEPFGDANKTPIFQINNVKIQSIRSLSEGKHLKMAIKDENNNRWIDIIGFNMGSLSEDYKLGMRVDLLGNLAMNKYNGIETIQITLKDIRHTV